MRIISKQQRNTNPERARRIADRAISAVGKRQLPFSRLALVAVLVVVAGCGDDSGGGGDEDLVWPTLEWRVDVPEAYDMDGSVLDGAREYAFQDGKNTQGVVVVRRGVIVGEWYEDGRDESSFATSWSVAKSFTSALIGIAIDEGLIDSVDVSMAEFLPEWTGTEKADIRLRDVLSMASGLQWSESYAPGNVTSSDIIQMILFQEDHLAYAASRPLEVPPGTRWSYSSGDTMLLSGVLEAVTGGNVGSYALEKLFDPIGMSPVDWWTDSIGQTATYCCIDTPARQFAKFGLLYLRGGEWEGIQIVPPAWVTTSTSPSVVPHYGYQWWLDETPEGREMYSALGHDGQYIYVIPDLDLVVVRTGHYDKYPGEPRADPSLWSLLPSDALVEGLGSVPPDSWSDEEFLAPVEASISK